MAAGKSPLTTVREIEEEGLSLVRRCELLDVNRSSVYYATDACADESKTPKAKPVREDQKEKEEMMAIIDETHTDLPATGARKMAKMIRRSSGYKCTRYLAGKLMEEMNIKPVYPHMTDNLSIPRS